MNRKTVKEMSVAEAARPHKKYPPMRTADGRVIAENGVLWRSVVEVTRFTDPDDCDDSDDEDDGAPVRAEPLRVIRVDPRMRTVRARCSRGCEEVFSFDGCTRDTLYADAARAEKCAARKVAAVLKKLDKETMKYAARAKKIRSLKIQRAAIPPSEETA